MIPYIVWIFKHLHYMQGCLVEIRGVEPLAFSMPSADNGRTEKGRARQPYILADCHTYS